MMVSAIKSAVRLAVAFCFGGPHSPRALGGSEKTEPPTLDSTTIVWYSIVDLYLCIYIYICIFFVFQ